ncbi:hypothetical protein N6H14_19385 [Paenibacillus sp. CC-CFT747]|nr:hypothetical protein N6H14_19385 [Paenibacillus sp. CC-CFT747]
MKIAMISANYFGRASGYRTSMDEWGAAERRVIERASLEEFDRICADIAGAGFRHMELWMAHAFPKFMTPFLAEEMKAVWERHKLEVIGYSCSLGDPSDGRAGRGCASKLVGCSESSRSQAGCPRKGHLPFTGCAKNTASGLPWRTIRRSIPKRSTGS